MNLFSEIVIFTTTVFDEEFNRELRFKIKFIKNQKVLGTFGFWLVFLDKLKNWLVLELEGISRDVCQRFVFL